MPNNTVYYLSRLRLINYHGLEDETIEVADGAHLLLAGTDRNHATALLDAVCAAMTGIVTEKELAETLNQVLTPAAAPAPERLFYFRPEELTGPSYVAVEVEGTRNRHYTLVVGRESGKRKNEASAWGAILETPVDLIAFRSDGPGTPVRTAAQFHDLLHGKGFFRRIDGYRRKVIEKFFGTSDAQAAWCLALMSGRVWNHGSLVNGGLSSMLCRLLPQPELDPLTAVVPFFGRMSMQLRRFEQLQLRSARLASYREALEAVNTWQRELALTEIAVAMLSLDALRRQEKELARQPSNAPASEKKHRKAAPPVDWKKLAAEVTALLIPTAPVPAPPPRRRGRPARHPATVGTGIAGVKESLRALFDEYQSLGLNLDSAKRTILADTNLATSLTGPAWNEIFHAIETENIRLLHTKQQSEQELDNRLDREEELQLEIIELEKCPEAQPDINFFTDAVQALEKLQIDFIPLYQGLEWQAETPLAERSKLEEFLGLPLLGLLVIANDDYSRAAELLLHEYPGIRIACAFTNEKPSAPFLQWIGQYLDLKTSDEHCLVILEKELAGNGMPSFMEKNDSCWYESRAHSAALFLWEPGLIGSEARRLTQTRKIDERESELNSLTQEINQLKKQFKADSERLKDLAAFTAALQQQRRELAEAWRQNLSAALPGQSADPVELQTKVAAILQRELAAALPAVGVATAAASEAAAGGKKTEQIQTELKSVRTRLKQLLETARRDFRLDDPAEMANGLCQCQGWVFAEEAERHADQLRGRLAAIHELIDRLLSRNNSLLCTSFEYDEHRATLQLDGKPLAEIDAALTVARDQARKELDAAAAQVVEQLIENKILTTIQEHQSIIREIGRYVNACIERIETDDGQSWTVELQPSEERYRNLDSIISRYAFYNRNSEQALKNWLIQEGEDSEGEGLLKQLRQLLDCRNWYRWHLVGKTPDEQTAAEPAAVPNPAAVMCLLAAFAFRCRESGIRLPVIAADLLFEQMPGNSRAVLLEQSCDLGVQILAIVPESEIAETPELPATRVFKLRERVTIGRGRRRNQTDLLPGFELD